MRTFKSLQKPGGVCEWISFETEEGIVAVLIDDKGLAVLSQADTERDALATAWAKLFKAKCEKLASSYLVADELIAENLKSEEVR